MLKEIITMRKFNEICKELDDKEAQKLLEESYNDVVAMRAVLVNKLIENTKKMRENYILFKTFADVINPKNTVEDNTYNFSAAQLAAYIESENLAVERKIASKAVDAFISTLERLEEQSLVTKAEAERIKRIVLDEIKLTVSDLKNAA
jgi:site-specific recombinase XerC